MLFYGSMTPRREAIFQALAAASLKLVVAFRVYGAERDALIARAKVVLNLHAYDDWGFEIVRIAYLLSNRKAVVCEANAPEDIDADLRDGLFGVTYGQLVDACRALVQDGDMRRRLERAGWDAFRQRDEVAILRAALTAPRPPPSVLAPVGATHAVAMRERYLDLLAKCLTNQIYGDAPFDYWSGGLFNAQTRSLGRDWPSQAMTMIGDARLNNIRWLFEAIVAAGVPGDLIETGVWRGGACIFMRGLLLAYEMRDRRVWVADSFAGLPPPDPRHVQDSGDRHHSFPELSIGLQTVQENFRKFGLLDDQVRVPARMVRRDAAESADRAVGAAAAGWGHVWFDDGRADGVVPQGVAGRFRDRGRLRRGGGMPRGDHGFQSGARNHRTDPGHRRPGGVLAGAAFVVRMFIGKRTFVGNRR